jgi:mannose-6-phosphate isomerase
MFSVCRSSYFFRPRLWVFAQILSVQTALSIQAHPDKALAEKLHAERPNVYKDENHKPEMAVAISEFEALSGFVTTEELVTALESVPGRVWVWNRVWV